MGSLKKKICIIVVVGGGGREMVSLSRGEASVLCVSEPVLLLLSLFMDHFYCPNSQDLNKKIKCDHV